MPRAPAGAARGLPPLPMRGASAAGEAGAAAGGLRPEGARVRTGARRAAGAWYRRCMRSPAWGRHHTTPTRVLVRSSVCRRGHAGPSHLPPSTLDTTLPTPHTLLLPTSLSPSSRVLPAHDLSALGDYLSRFAVVALAAVLSSELSANSICHLCAASESRWAGRRRLSFEPADWASCAPARRERSFRRCETRTRACEHSQ